MAQLAQPHDAGDRELEISPDEMELSGKDVFTGAWIQEETQRESREVREVDEHIKE